MSEHPTASIGVNNRLELTVTDRTRKGGAVKARLSQVDAQLLAIALLEYAGARTKSAGRGPMTYLPAEAVACTQVVKL